MTSLEKAKFVVMLVPVLLCTAGKCVFAQTKDGGAYVLTGTVNILLGNRNGVVAFTDSKQSGRAQNGQTYSSPRRGQKLFQLDDKTICTIAGFASIRMAAFPDFISSAAAILARYRDEVSKSPGVVLTFHEKMATLSQLLDFYLTGLGNLQNVEAPQLDDYGFELILAGYDADGAPKIGKIVVSASSSPGGIFRPVVTKMTETAVRAELIHKTAGIGGPVAENILSYPKQFIEQPEIRKYAESKNANEGASLNIEDMLALVRALGHHAATVYPQVVGGADQLAVLENGRARIIQQPSAFEAPPKNEFQFHIVMGLELDMKGGIGAGCTAVRQGSIGLFLKMTFLNCDVFLDRGYYFDDKFVNTTLYYDGDLIAFEENSIENTSLVLGPHSANNPAFVSDLLRNFNWKSVRRDTAK